ncbi:MAG: hypothetical protein ACXVCV_15155 [Polyangia bacterium]
MRRLLASCSTALVLALGASTGRSAALHHRISLAGGGEISATPDFNGHGFFLVRYDLDGLPRSAHLAAELNTDTLRLSYDHLRLGRVELGVAAAGEVLIAGLLTDYYRDGQNDSGRGFWASYGSVTAAAKIDLAPHFVELAVGARRWFFSRAGATSPALTLPPEAWVGEVRLRYTLWQLAGDRSLWEPQRLFPRLRGVAFGVELGLDARSQARPWGARDDAAFALRDLRNDPSRTIFSARQWLRAGTRLHRRVRLQLDETASWMWGADDLARLRVGGLNPYSVPLVGAPWAGYLASDVAALDASLHVRVAREHEVGVLVDGVALDDADRTGGATARPAVLAGVGLFADLRVGAWQLDVRGGWSPTLRPGTVAGGFTLFAALGWGWSR